MKSIKKIEQCLKEEKATQDKYNNEEMGVISDQFDSEDYSINKGWVEALEWVLEYHN